LRADVLTHDRCGVPLGSAGAFGLFQPKGHEDGLGLIRSSTRAVHGISRGRVLEKRIMENHYDRGIEADKNPDDGPPCRPIRAWRRGEFDQPWSPCHGAIHLVFCGGGEMGTEDVVVDRRHWRVSGADESESQSRCHIKGGEEIVAQWRPGGEPQPMIRGRRPLISRNGRSCGPVFQPTCAFPASRPGPVAHQLLTQPRARRNVPCGGGGGARGQSFRVIFGQIYTGTKGHAFVELMGRPHRSPKVSEWGISILRYKRD